MPLLAPALLAGLALLAVPVLIHLTRRQRGEVTPFPSLMFLRRIPFRTTRRKHIRDPLLFALRCLAVVLIALAFARPFVPGGGAGADEAARDVVLLLDTSGSLAFGDRRAVALEAARRSLEGLAEGDRAALVTFDDRATERVGLTADLVAVRTALDAVRPSDRPTRLEAGLQLAGRILAESDRAGREIVLISDFQRTGWDGTGRTRLPDGVMLRTEDVAGGGAPNVAVADVRFAGDDGAGSEGGRHRILARVLNLGDAPVPGLEVSLELAGRTVATRAVDLASRATATVAFEDVPVPAGAPRGGVRIDADGLPTDDVLRFMATPEPVLSAVLVETARGRADRSLFLVRALDLGEAPRVRVERRPAGQLDASLLARTAAVVLNDATPGDAAGRDRLHDWVAAGGALFVVLGPESTPARWSRDGGDAALLGGEVGAVGDRAGRGGSRLAWLDYDHAVFELFADPGSGDFASARFWRFRHFEPGPDTRVLARFEDGEPALLEHAIGEGRVLVWTSTLDRYWNDLALQPVFLPFVHRILRHAVGWRPPERWVATGAERELAGLLGEAGPDAGTDAVARVLVTPGEERRPLERPWIEFDEAGFYRVEPLDGDGPTATVAVNLPLAESDLATVAPERVAADVVGAAANGAGGRRGDGEVGTTTDAAGDESAAGVPGRRELWWPLLLLAGLVLGAESWIANRRARRSA